MTTIVWPSSIKIVAADYQPEFDVQLNIMRSGRVDTYGLPGHRWVATITFPGQVVHTAEDDAQRGRVEALIMSLRGGARKLQMGYFGRPVPNGALRGSPKLASPTTVGANTISLKDCNGGVLAGDILGLGTQLLMVEEDASPIAGAMTVKVSPCVRAVYSADTAIVWNRPTCLWVQQESVSFPFLPNVRPEFSIKLVEAG